MLACFQGVNIPFGYIEIIARSAQALPTPDLDNSFESMKKWRKEQQKDPQLCETIDLLHGLDRYEKRKNILKKYPLTEPYLKILNQLELKDDILYRRVYSMDQGVKTCLWQLVLPQQLISRALIGCHDQCGHQGRDRTLCRGKDSIGLHSTMIPLSTWSPVESVCSERVMFLRLNWYLSQFQDQWN